PSRRSFENCNNRVGPMVAMFWRKSGHHSDMLQCPLLTDTVEKVVSDPPKRNNRIRTARYLNRNCVRGRDFESMLRIQGRKIVFQQYRPKADKGQHHFAVMHNCTSPPPVRS